MEGLQYVFSMPPPNWDALCDSATGRIASFASPAGYSIRTKARLLDRSIVFEKSRGPQAQIRGKDSLLERFANAKTDAEIVALADEFGPLGFSRRLSLKNPQRIRATAALAAENLFGVYSELIAHCAEPVAAWRNYQGRLGLILRMAVLFRNGESARDEDWKKAVDLGLLTPDDLERGMGALRGYRPDARVVAAIVLTGQFVISSTSDLIDCAALRPRLRFAETLDLNARPPRDTRFTINLGADTAIDPASLIDDNSLLGILTLQLLTAVAGVSGTVCASCGAWYTPSRRPAAGRKNYCRRCGRAAAVRDAKARLRARKKEGETNGKTRKA